MLCEAINGRKIHLAERDLLTQCPQGSTPDVPQNTNMSLVVMNTDRSGVILNGMQVTGFYMENADFDPAGRDVTWRSAERKEET
jgi:hypothetical protein